MTLRPGACWSSGIAETHISWVFFVGDRAYKLKKPVRTAFLDFSTIESRRLDCEREVALNRRLAPDVYEGVATVMGVDGEVCDHLVVMKRMPDERRLSAQVQSHATEPALRRSILAIARRLASFHAAAERSTQIDAAGSPEVTASRWLTNTAQLRPFVDEVLDADLIEEVDRLAARYVAGRAPLLEQRIADGRVLDGHGDLLADDIFCLDDGPRILDCLEFDDGLRWGDGLADAAFLAMDLERLGRLDLSSVLLSAYEAASGDSWPQSLAGHYIAYRALIRSKVACLRASQGADTAQEDARLLLELAARRLREAAVRMVLVGGAPGTGKSSLAATLGRALGWPVLRSDTLRTEFAGLSPGVADGRDQRASYGTAATQRTYDELVARGAALAQLGQTVILDATWTSERHRAQARAAAQETATDLVELRCVAPATMAADRLVRRREAGTDPSEATPAIALAMAAGADPWPEAVAIDTTGSVDEAAARAMAAVSEGRR